MMAEDMDNEQNLTRAKRRELKMKRKKQEREEKLKSKERKKQFKNLMNYGAAIVILLLVISFFYMRSIPPKNAPVIDINPESYEFGFVSQNNGAVSTTMTITNTGTENLILNNMDTSCGCTSASIVDDGKEGPRFSMAMHGTNPAEWQQVVAPGESVELKVYYDPNVHKNLHGTVTRSVFIYSNDWRNPKKEVRISATQ